MALVPIRVDRTSKPPIGTPLRSDGHWSVQGLVGAWAFNSGSGKTILNSATSTQSALVGSATNTLFGLLSTGGQNYAPLGTVHRGKISMLWSGRILSQADSSFFAGADQVDDVGWDFGLYRSTSSQKIAFYVDTGTTASVSTLSEVNINQKTTIIGSYFDDKLAIYRDGILQGETSKTGTIQNRYQGVLAGGWASVGISSETELLLVYDRSISPVISANPWQIYEPETVWVEVGGGGEQSLFAGTVYGQSSASAQLSTAITIASQVFAAGNIAGGLTTAIALASSVQGSSSATANLNTSIALAAQILGIGSASAALTNAITMAAQAVGLGSISGELAGTVAAALFAGTISGSSSASANLTTAIIMAGAAQGESTSQAALATALALAAQVNGSSEASALMTTAIELIGISIGRASVSGRLAEPVEVLAQLQIMARDPLALKISASDPLALNIAVK